MGSVLSNTIKRYTTTRHLSSNCFLARHLQYVVVRTIPTTFRSTKSVWAIPFNSQHPKSIVWTIPFSKQHPKSIVQTNPMNRQLAPEINCLDNSSNLVDNTRNQLSGQFQLIVGSAPEINLLDNSN